MSALGLRRARAHLLDTPASENTDFATLAPRS